MASTILSGKPSSTRQASITQSAASNPGKGDAVTTRKKIAKRRRRLRTNRRMPIRFPSIRLSMRCGESHYSQLVLSSFLFLQSASRPTTRCQGRDVESHASRHTVFKSGCFHPIEVPYIGCFPPVRHNGGFIEVCNSNVFRG